MICPHCKKDNYNDNAIVCAYCHQPMHAQPVYQQPAQPVYQQPVQSVYQQPAQPVYQQPTQPVYQQGVVCPRCGNVCDPQAAICVKCTYPIGGVEYDEASTGLKILSFLVPLIGLILFAVNYYEKPESAKEYGKMALISVGVGVVLMIFPEIFYSIF